MFVICWLLEYNKLSPSDVNFIMFPILIYYIHSVELPLLSHNVTLPSCPSWYPPPPLNLSVHSWIQKYKIPCLNPRESSLWYLSNFKKSSYECQSIGNSVVVTKFLNLWTLTQTIKLLWYNPLQHIGCTSTHIWPSNFTISKSPTLTLW